MNQSNVKESVKQWVESIVIGLNLCPFAKKVYDQQAIRFVCSEADSQQLLLIDIYNELKTILEDPLIKTTLLIHPHVLQDFTEYNAFLDLTDALLEAMHFEGVFQIASFHPDYQFANTTPEDPENFTNRSPFPILHILREDDIEKAIATHPDIEGVPIRNQRRMKEMGAVRMQALLNACLK